MSVKDPRTMPINDKVKIGVKASHVREILTQQPMQDISCNQVPIAAAFFRNFMFLVTLRERSHVVQFAPPDIFIISCFEKPEAALRAIESASEAK